jgi:hypothetical protein
VEFQLKDQQPQISPVNPKGPGKVKKGVADAACAAENMGRVRNTL